MIFLIILLITAACGLWVYLFKRAQRKKRKVELTMENFINEIFDCTEWTVPCIVPRYWDDELNWDDDDPMVGQLELRGIFSNDYLKLTLGTTGQESADPTVRIKTALIPNATEGDSITVDGTVYTVGTLRPDVRGVTIIDLHRPA